MRDGFPEPVTFPLQALLLSLSAAGIPVGLREFQDAARFGAELLARGQLRELPSALGALLGTSRVQSEQVEALVTAYLQSCIAPAVARPQTSVSPRRGRWGRWLELLFLLPFLAQAPSSPPPTQPVLPPTTAAPIRTLVLPTELGPSTLAPAKRRALLTQPRRAAPFLALPVFVVALAAVQRRRTDRLRSEVIAHVRQQLAALPEPTAFVLRSERQLLPQWPRALLDQVAAQLTRLDGNGGDGRILDAELTVRRTAQRAGLPELVYKATNQHTPLLVLLDVRPHMQLWLPRCVALVQGLAQRGLAVEWVCFGGTYCPASATLGDPTEPLRRLHAGAEMPVIVLSTGPQGPAAAAWEWTTLYKQAPRRAWLHPVGQPELWSMTVRQDRESLRLLPMTESGLLLATDLLTARSAGLPRTLREQESGAPLDLAATSVLAQLVGQCGPTDLQFAELLRQRLLPELSPLALLHLLAAGSDLAGKELRLTPTRGGPAMLPEPDGRAYPHGSAARELFLKVLRDSEPPPGSLAHMRWRLRLGIQEAVLTRGNPAKEAAALLELQSLAAGPLCEEVLAALQTIAEPGLGAVGKLGRLAGQTESALRAGRLPGSRARVATGVSAREALSILAASLSCALISAYALTVTSPVSKPAEVPSRQPQEAEREHSVQTDNRGSELPLPRALGGDAPAHPFLPTAVRRPRSPGRRQRSDSLADEAGRRVAVGASTSELEPAPSVIELAGPERRPSLDGGAPPDSAPGQPYADMVLIAGATPFYIERTEVANHQYERCVNAGVCTPPTRHDEACSYGLSGRDHFPVNCVSQEQARKYCAWTSRRLPKETEWERAASSAGSNRHAWGNGDTPSELCWRRNQGSCGTASKSGDMTASGVYDLAANLREWVSEPGVTRGGTWHDTDVAQLSVQTRSLVASADQLSDLGFRCASD